MKKSLLTLLALLTLCAACSDSQVLTPSQKLDSERLRKILPTLDTRASRDGVGYGVQVVDGVATPMGPRRVQNKDETSVTPTSREELIENNKKQPVENRVEGDLLADYRDFTAGNLKDHSILAMVLFVDDLDLPLLPEPNENEARDSQENKKVTKTYEETLRIIKEIRSQEIKKRLAEVPDLADVEVLYIHTLVNAVDLRMKLSDVGHLIEMPDVQYVSYQEETVPLK